MGFKILAEDLGAPEGPVFTSDGSLVVTSMERGHLYSIREGGRVKRLVNTGGDPNGLAQDANGVFYIAQNGGHGPWHKRPTSTGGVQVFEPDGRLTWLTQDLISPNDICLGPDGYLYVTDPTRRPSRDDGRIWRVHPITGAAELLLSVGWYPNGVGFSISDNHIYFASTGTSQIIRFDLNDGQLSNETVVVDMPYGRPDGFAFDVEGNLILAAIGPDGDFSAPGQVQVWSPSGELLESINPGPSHHYTNVALNESKQLVLTDSDAGRVLIFEDWPTRGLPMRKSLPAN